MTNSEQTQNRDLESSKVLVRASFAGQSKAGWTGNKVITVHAFLYPRDQLDKPIKQFTDSFCKKTHGIKSAGWMVHADTDEITCRRCAELASHHIPVLPHILEKKKPRKKRSKSKMTNSDKPFKIVADEIGIQL